MYHLKTLLIESDKDLFKVAHQFCLTTCSYFANIFSTPLFALSHLGWSVSINTSYIELN